MSQLGSTGIKRVPLTALDTNAHSAGDVVAKFDLAPLDGVTGGVLLKQIAIFDDAGQAAALTFLFYEGALDGTYTLNSPPAPSAADKAKFLAAVFVAATDYQTAGGDSYGCKECALGLRHTPAGPGANGGRDAAGSLTVVVLANGTPTYAAASLQLAFGFLPDGA